MDTKEKPTPRTKIVEPPITGDEKMVRRPPKDKKKDGNTVDPNYVKDIEKDMPFDEKFKKASPEKRKMMMAKGGYVKAADGCVKRGKTKGRMV